MAMLTAKVKIEKFKEKKTKILCYRWAMYLKIKLRSCTIYIQAEKIVFSKEKFFCWKFWFLHRRGPPPPQCRVFDFTWPNLVIFSKLQETMSKCFENFLYLYRNVTGGHFVLLWVFQFFCEMFEFPEKSKGGTLLCQKNFHLWFSTNFVCRFFRS